MKFASLLLFLFMVSTLSAQPVALHPENPHYLIYQGAPTILVTSAEHYGAVLNAAFDYKTYLETLQRDGMNYTRIFAGTYVEVPGSFGIKYNTLAPAAGQYVTPWKRLDEPGLYEGEGRLDLSQWNPGYFLRLRDFVAEAAARDVIVELTFFCATYTDDSWLRHPFNPGNNVNDLGELARQESSTLKNGKLVAIQQELVRKIVTELNAFDNLFYEIQNEPWADNGERIDYILRTHRLPPEQQRWAHWVDVANAASLGWQKIIAATISETEKGLPKKHLIAQNFCNYKASLKDVDPNVSILNFHYAWPDAVWMNYGWNRPVNFDESGFSGSNDTAYLEQAWAFLLAGGAVFNNLDYSFYTGAEDGRGSNQAPGGGSAQLRWQLRILRDFLKSFDFIRMQPDRQVVALAPGLEWQALSEPGKQYAVFFSGNPGREVKLDLPKGKYRYQFLAPEMGQVIKEGVIQAKEKAVSLDFPAGTRLAALRVIRE